VETGGEGSGAGSAADGADKDRGAGQAAESEQGQLLLQAVDRGRANAIVGGARSVKPTLFWIP
jgi:hypothetical protein